MQPLVTRTLNQLHFDVLEPHRFEDLVRQLAYGFKSWKDLEDTGRMGSDDGFDARGTELTPSGAKKLWLFQCKREKEITPKKLEGYLDDIFDNQETRIDCIVFAAPCSFSKKARDLFDDICKKHGLSEAYIWDRSRLEDMLFQPEHRSLLFAYFGVSLGAEAPELELRIVGQAFPAAVSLEVKNVTESAVRIALLTATLNTGEKFRCSPLTPTSIAPFALQQFKLSSGLPGLRPEHAYLTLLIEFGFTKARQYHQKTVQIPLLRGGLDEGCYIITTDL